MPAQAEQAEYERRRAESIEVEHRLDSWSAAFGHGRVLLVFVALVLSVLAYARGTPILRTPMAVLGGLAFATLFAQGFVDKRQRIAHLRVALYERSLARLNGDWRTFPSKGEHLKDPKHPYAPDLDIFGDGSLFQLLDTTRTAQGETTLARWLLHASAYAEILTRREAVQALAPDIDGREALALAGADEDLSRLDERPLVAWAEGPRLLALSPALLWTARILPFVTGIVYGLGHWDVIPRWPLIPLAVAHALVLQRTRRGVNALGKVAEDAELKLSRLLPLLDVTQQVAPSTPRLSELRERLRGASESIRSLRGRVTAFQSRGNLLVAVLIPTVFWDIHTAWALEVWQERTRGALRTWFEAIGELEALSALATYAYEHPDDVWPEISDGPASFAAESLGHPLLPADRCVRNSVALDGPGTALLVTGSNMSGKSTLLRAVGVNAVMALAGLPVRAITLRLSRVQVATVMRVADSLQEGASFFLAEVKRLKGVVDLAKGERPVLFLLDEILQGTNTRERSLGARGVIAHLLEAGAFGLVSTHDLSLVQLGDAFGERIKYAHFTDQVEGDRMFFDYQLRSGVVQTSNALRLMRAMGIEVDVPAEERPLKERA